jgi:hypothetical protein
MDKNHITYKFLQWIYEKLHEKNVNYNDIFQLIHWKNVKYCDIEDLSSIDSVLTIDKIINHYALDFCEEYQKKYKNWKKNLENEMKKMNRDKDDDNDILTVIFEKED